MEPQNIALAITAIVEVALALAALSSLVTVGLTGFFKEQFPSANPRFFSIPCGMGVTGVAYFATLPAPDTLMGWMALVLIVIVGALIPSGLFDAGINLMAKAQKRIWTATEVEADSGGH